MKECFFCEIQRTAQKRYIAENKTCFAVYDGFPVSKGHVLIVPKDHIESYFDLKAEQLLDCDALLKKAQHVVAQKFHPDGYNIGINEGRAAGRTIDHLHIHLIPRYQGDLENPTGGVRNVIPDKGDYTKGLKK